MKRNTLTRTGLLALLFALHAFAEDRYILRLKSGGDIKAVARAHGLTIEDLKPDQKLFVVKRPSSPGNPQVVQALRVEPSVQQVEQDAQVALPELAGVPSRQPGAPLLPPLYSSRSMVNFYGASVWGAYVDQPAASIIRMRDGQRLATGSGIVALIDTGVDFNCLALKSSLVQGYDFTRSIPGGSEMTDVSQSTTEVLDQSTTEVLDHHTVITLNQSTTEVLDQSTTEVLDKHHPPSAFGHGTMTAGLVHLVAPTAKLMPLKAFSGDGTATMSRVISAIYYAVDHGARVISMSFNSTADSPELRAAIRYANEHDVICVAAVGNDGKQTNQIYPGTYNNVIGVGSTNNFDQRSAFSNYGNQLVVLAAPGEGLITTYPGRNNYAAGWGTSFSTPLVAGGAAMLLSIDRGTDEGDAEQSFKKGADPVQSPGMGAGRLDLLQTLGWAKQHH